MPQSTDDALTLIALGVLAFVVADVTHEVLGHGLAILAVGAKPVILTTSYFGSRGCLNQWIPAGGGIANVVMGFLSLLTLAIAFNLLFATAYPFYFGIAAFGDWGE